jgi:hypothetical protein
MQHRLADPKQDGTAHRHIDSSMAVIAGDHRSTGSHRNPTDRLPVRSKQLRLHPRRQITLQ